MHVTVERCEVAGGLGHGITLGKLGFALVTENDFTHYFDPSNRLVIADSEDCPNVAGELPLTGLPPGGTSPRAVRFSRAPEQAKILGNKIRAMGGSGISVVGFGRDPTSEPFLEQWMVEASALVVADNLIEFNYLRPAHAAPTTEMLPKIAFGGVILGVADSLRVHDNVIRNNGVNHLYPVCGVFVYHGEDVGVENNQIHTNGPRVVGTGLSGNRAGICLLWVGRRLFETGPDAIAADAALQCFAARVRGNVVDQPAGRALEIYGLGAMFVEGNVLVSRGLVGGAPDTVGHCVEIQNLGQSPELILQGVVPSLLGFIPAPQLPRGELPLEPTYFDGRILFTDNQVHFRPAADAAHDIGCASRFQSYGDVAVLDNQFVTTFPTTRGDMVVDTLVQAWSTRTNNNRWEDPAQLIAGEYQTQLSASTTARMNFTALNQASRCIQVTISPNSPTVLNNPYIHNQTPTACDPEPAFAGLLAPAP
jgi:hypothetical protein